MIETISFDPETHIIVNKEQYKKEIEEIKLKAWQEGREAGFIEGKEHD